MAQPLEVIYHQPGILGPSRIIMPATSPARPRRSAAVRAALVGATRALDAAYPVPFGEVLPDLLSEGLAALMAAGSSTATRSSIASVYGAKPVIYEG